jgi:hypothetical protein
MPGFEENRGDGIFYYKKGGRHAGAKRERKSG